MRTRGLFEGEGGLGRYSPVLLIALIHPSAWKGYSRK
jgi:hypothetical protein